MIKMYSHDLQLFYALKIGIIVDSENQIMWTIIIQVRIKSDTNHHLDIHQPMPGVCTGERKASSDFCVPVLNLRPYSLVFFVCNYRLVPRNNVMKIYSHDLQLL